MIKRSIALILTAITLFAVLTGCISRGSDVDITLDTTAPHFTPETTIPSTSPAPSATVPPQTTEEAKEAECSVFSFTVDKSKNKNMCESLVGSITENEITLTVTAPTDSFSLRNALVDVTTDADKIEFSLEYTDGTVNLMDETGSCCILTDKNGLKKRYDIIVEYAESVIPVISINVDGGKNIISKEEYVDATVSIDTSGVNGWYLPDGFSSLEPTRVEIRGRGNSTWNWDKKPYKLKFHKKTEVLGMAEAKKWVLLANYADYSLMRNYVAYETTKVLSNELCPLSQYPVNLFVNGEYKGVYTIGEDRDISETRIDLPDNNGMADTSFLLEIGGTETNDVYGLTALHTSLVRYCSIEYPEDDEVTKEQAQFITDYITNANEAIKTLDGYEKYIDVTALIDWFISTELFYNLESCFRRSCFIMKESGGLLKMGPVWDYDLAMGNLYNDFGDYTSWANLSQKHEYIEDNWMCYLMKDPAFRDKLKTRWDEVKDELLTKALYCVDEMGKTLSVSAEYNFRIWNVLGKRAVNPQPKSVKNYKTYESNV